MRVWMLDPAAMTPHYDLRLTAALGAQGVQVRLLTSRFLYEDHVPLAEQFADHFFFRPLESGAQTLRERPWPRRLLRLAIYPFDLARLWRAFQSDPPDLLHVQWTWFPLLDRGLIRRMAARVPVVLTVHDTLPRAASMTRLADMRPLYDLAAHFIVHAEENRQALLARSGVEPSRVSVVPHGPLMEELPAPSRSAAREALRIDPGAKVILFFGVIKPYKGLLDLIEAVALLRPEFPDVHLLIVGRPEGSVEPYTAAIAEKGLAGCTSFYPGFAPTEQVPLYFAAGDVVCLPYHEASQSGVLLTAYRFGRPVVVTGVGGLPESVEEDGNGYIVPPKDPPALAAALARIIADPEKAERFGRRSQELARTRFSWERAARLTQEVYARLLSARSRREGNPS